MSKQESQKSERASREEEILSYWKENDIFKKTLDKKAPEGEFVFYDGPPFATGLPHYGSLLSSVVKDVFPRYKTMRGYRVDRRWGWDCHGLPIENMIEKELGLKSKKDIEKLGVGAFNKAARKSVLRLADEWEWYVDRVGRWAEFSNSYKTMDNTYIESVWWAIKQVHEDKLLYEGRKVLLYCPHCETPLAKAEIAMDNSYKNVTEEAVTIKFEVRDANKHDLPEKTYMLAWTTTPWTLPGNVALAVSPDVDYSLIESDGHHYILASELVSAHFDEGVTEVKKIKGKDLINFEYVPLFDIEAVKNAGQKGWYVAEADFVSTDEGTGLVHTAVIHGEDDYELGLASDLPMVPLLDSSGVFTQDAPALIRGAYFKDAEQKIKDDLESRGLLFKKDNHTHSYPFCYRCETPLLYNAITSWFIDIAKVKNKLLKNNEKINWFPLHIKHGRFQNIVENAPDWTISRNRYWASPLPIWKNPKTGDINIFGSVDDMKRRTALSGNIYHMVRHGEAESNAKNVLNSDPKLHNPLTQTGQDNARKAGRKLKKANIDLIFHSPLQRTRETAELIASELGLDGEASQEDNRLREVEFGEFEGKSVEDYHSYFAYTQERMTKVPKGGEDWGSVKRRITEFLYEIEEKYKDKNILIVSHNGPLVMLQAGAVGSDNLQCAECIDTSELEFQTGEHRELKFVPIPHNDSYELDLHRPYIDEIELCDKYGEKLVRIPEVVDCWIESGSMPFAAIHYPFENNDKFKKMFPADFIAEYIGQTRTWFYYMHAMATLQFDDVSFKNVVVTGNVQGSDGRKMSKSYGNYTDPADNLTLYGADALRFYLMQSVVMQAEDTRFLDEELREIHNKVINIFWNTFKFFDLYQEDIHGDDLGASSHVLDRWIQARVNEVTREVTESMDLYNTVSSCRSLQKLINDFSTWYVRRSRSRFKEDNRDDRQNALVTTKRVLISLSKLMAPFTPFVADDVYRNAGGELESVHLDSWASCTDKLSKSDRELLQDMQEVRRIVSRGLEARSSAGIRVRQPLSELKIKSDSLKDKEDLVELIRDEVNVKTIAIDEELSEEVVLVTDINDELREEGMVRELERHIQGLRKEAGLTQGDVVSIVVETDNDGRKFVEKHMDRLAKKLRMSEIKFDSNGGKDLIVEKLKMKFTLR
jgi:isoleucyl-tRNA synthetase